jgi:putative endonuclease
VTEPFLLAMYFVYILHSLNKDRYYIGQTDNLILRLDRHNQGEVRSTAHGAPWKLVYWEKHESRSMAMTREKEIKSQKNRRFIEALIAKLNGRVPHGGINH